MQRQLRGTSDIGSLVRQELVHFGSRVHARGRADVIIIQPARTKMKTPQRTLRDLGIALAAAVLCGVINPSLVGCSGGTDEESEWSYDDHDMEAAVVGDYSGQVNGKPILVRLSRPKAASSAGPNIGALPRQLQCGSRSFVRPAGACVSVSSLDIDAEVESEASVLASGKLTGQFSVYGRALSFGQLNFPSSRLNADFEDGAITRWYVYDAASDTSVELPLSRVH